MCRPLGHPRGVNPERFHLIAPYEKDSRKWLNQSWIDQYSGTEYRITTAGSFGDRRTARVKTYSDVLIEYEYHPESKCADADGDNCGKQTDRVCCNAATSGSSQMKYIGKESNSLEEVDAGLIHSEQTVYTEFPDPRRDEWQIKILPALQKIHRSRSLRRKVGYLAVPAKVRAGRSRPHRRIGNYSWQS